MLGLRSDFDGDAELTPCAAQARRRQEAASAEEGAIVNATGFRPDLDMLRELRLQLDEVVEAPVMRCGSGALVPPLRLAVDNAPPQRQRNPDVELALSGAACLT